MTIAMHDFDDEAFILALEEAARRDPRFKAVPHPNGFPDAWTYLDTLTGEPEWNPMGSTAEEAFARAHDLAPAHDCEAVRQYLQSCDCGADDWRNQ